MHTAIKILVTLTFAAWLIKSWAATVVLAAGAATVEKVATSRGTYVPAAQAQRMSDAVGRQVGAALLLTLWLIPLAILFWIF